MAYSTANPPALLVTPPAGGTQLWSYASTDVHTDVDAADYFSNGDALGMRENDTVIVTKTSATVGATLHTVTAVTAGGAATVSAGILAQQSPRTWHASCRGSKERAVLLLAGLPFSHSRGANQR
jgi:hypothetical protein